MAVKKTTEQENTGSVKDLTRLMKQGGSQEDVQKKMKELASTSSKPSTAQPSAVDYSKAYENYRDQYLNRGDFSFDVNTDALYKQYKDQYTNAGKRAMQDTIGQAAAMTGGYGNSYAQTAGQQTYNQYMTDLTAQIPELYQLAREMYDREGEDLMNKYSMLYGEARDQKADEQWQQTFDRGVYEFDTSLDYQKSRDEIEDNFRKTEYDRSVLESDRAFNYQKERDEIDDDWREKEFAYKKSQDAESNAQTWAQINKTSEEEYIPEYEVDFEMLGFGSADELSSYLYKLDYIEGDDALYSTLEKWQAMGVISPDSANELYLKYFGSVAPKGTIPSGGDSSTIRENRG